MRSKNSLINIIVTISYFIINNIFTFISKSVFIMYLGIEYSGLNAFLLNIIGVLNLAELGISTSIGYSLYKPLKEENYIKITEILTLFKKLYQCIGIFILCVGIVVMIFIDNLVTTTISIFEIRIYFLLYLFSILTSYFLTYTNVLPAADQKNYIVIQTQGNVKIIKNIIELLSILFFKNFLIWLIIEIFGNIVSYIICNIKIKHLYNKINFSNSSLRLKQLLKKYDEIVYNIKNLFFHQIGSLVVNQTDNLLISKFCNLIEVGKYTNYIYIYTLLTGCIDQAFNSITGSIGNLLVDTEGTSKSYDIWKKIYVITYFIAVLFSFLFYHLSYGFISLWVSKENSLSNIVVFFIALNIFFRIVKCPTERFKVAYGIFYDKYAPLIESLINLIISIILVQYFGVLGVVVGTVISNIIIIYMWKPYITFRDGFQQPFRRYIIISMKLVITSFIAVFLTSYVINYIGIIINSWLYFILAIIYYGLISIIMLLIVFSLNSDFRSSLKYIILKLMNIIRKS